VQRWEYKVISLKDGRYTEALNEYGQSGWELVGIASDVHDQPVRQRGRGVPIPGALGKLEGAASRFAASGSDHEPDPGATFTTLLWVLRRPIDDEH